MVRYRSKSDPVVALENMRLLRSIHAGSLGGVNAALDAGADATEVVSLVLPLKKGRATMLHEAAEYAGLGGDTDERTTIVRLLVAHGASLGTKSEFGNTPLHCAACANAAGAARVLLECGADPNAKNFSSEAPLHLAATHAGVEVIEVLLAHGANPQLTDSRGCKPHACAATAGKANVTAMLLAAEARGRLRRHARSSQP